MKSLTRYTAALAVSVAGLTACADSVAPTDPNATAAPVSPGTVVGTAMSGAIFTTNSLCNGTNVNIFAAKADVYVDGGPTHSGAAGLPDGDYYIQVTEPNGTLLGTSVGSPNPTPVHVVGGEFAVCYQLNDVVYLPTDLTTKGYNTTSNGGGEYKVWVSASSTFPGGETKTDNFKVIPDGGEIASGQLDVIKFYDANANGLNDDNQLITGWQVRVQDGIDLIRYTPVSLIVSPDQYTITESAPLESNWLHTTPNPVVSDLAAGAHITVEFGNVCVGAGGGKTLGFWSNKNGAKIIAGPPSLLAAVLALNLRKANGTLLGSVSLSGFQSFLLGASATNMANMLSAQLAAMYLNVASGGVNGAAMIYAPGTNSANALGFATVNAVMSEANALLGSADPLLILSGNPDRPRAEALKNALDNGNNNLNFVQPTPCAFSFAP
jgi:hypothetical protein